MSLVLDSTREIWQQALEKHPEPYAIVLALSGGNDSRATYYAAKALNIPVTHILHIHTGTGIQQTTEWVRWFATEHAKLPYLEGSAGNRFEKRVLTHGFIGRGFRAHEIAYHLLKRGALVKTLSQEIRQKKRNRTILLLNGARLSESDNRAKNFANTPIRADKPRSKNVWVNLLQHWSKQDCFDICDENHAPQNPVARELCRSGECMCGTMQEIQARSEASSIYPEWGRWLDSLEMRVKETFPWGWGEPVSKEWLAEKAGQMRLFDAETFQPMCSSCNANLPQCPSPTSTLRP